MSAKYKKYPEYKFSDGMWFGEIPIDWPVHKLGYEIDTIVPMRDKPTDLNGEIPWIRIEDFSGKFIDGSLSGQGVNQKTVDDMNLKIFPVGTVLCTCSCSMGTTAIVKRPLVSNQTFIGLVPRCNLNSEFLYFLMQASKEELTSQSSGAIQTYLSRDEFRALRLAFPSLNEQVKIANFLDHETAKIDTMIDKQQQLIKLLKEKRQAVISHAVTKGLNPAAPMKDSGVEWLGEVPEHWVVKQLRHLTSSLGGGTPSKDNPDYWDGDIPWISPKDMKKNYLDNAQDKITEQAVINSSAKLIPENSVLLVVRGMILAHSVPVAMTLRPVTINQDMKAFIADKGLLPEFLLFALQGAKSVLLDMMDQSAHGTKVLGTELLNRLSLGVPPIEEQKSILAELKKRLEVIDSTSKRAEEFVVLSNERRTALISAAVTGKIDVRNWQPAQSKIPMEASA